MPSEALRQAMLKQMGLTAWFPRVALPDAAPSYDYDDVASEQSKEIGGNGNEDNRLAPHLRTAPIAESDAGKPRPDMPELPAPAPRGAPSLRALSSLPATNPVPEIAILAEPVALVQTEDLVKDDPIPAFAFSWFSIDKRLAVLAMLPDGEAAVSGQCRQMLLRILAALSPDYKNVSSREHCFHWPFPDDLGLPSGSRAARQAVDGFVARRLRECPATMLLVLADETPPFLFRPSATAEEPGVLSVHRQLGFTMLRTHSLHSMNQTPELKRSAWQAMKVLLDRLNRHSK